MGLTLTVTLVLLTLFALIAVRVPVAFALASSGILGLVLLEGGALPHSVLGRQPFQNVASYTMVVVPMFIAMGVFAKHAHIAEGTFYLAQRALRRVPGGLALAALLACAGFAAVSGSSVATVVSVGRLAVAEMRRYGYTPEFAAGVVGAAGTLGVLIPPSIVLVIYGVLTGVSIGALLIAGIVPGVLSAVLYGVAIVWRARRSPELVSGLVAKEATGQPTDTASSQPPRSSSGADDTASPAGVSGSGGLVRIGLLFLIVVGGIYSGVFTAIESAAVGALAAFAILTVDSLRLRAPLGERVVRYGRVLRDSTVEAVSLNSMVFALLIGAGLFSAFTVYARIPQLFTGWALGLDVPPILLVAVLFLAFIPLGMFLDPLSIMLIGVPLAYPVVTGLGFDGVWFGILVVKAIEIGLITPPLGINAYVVAGTAEDISVETAFRGILWFLPVDLLTVAVLFLFPQLVLWLPAAVR